MSEIKELEERLRRDFSARLESVWRNIDTLAATVEKQGRLLAAVVENQRVAFKFNATDDVFVKESNECIARLNAASGAKAEEPRRKGTLPEVDVNDPALQGTPIPPPWSNGCACGGCKPTPSRAVPVQPAAELNGETEGRRIEVVNCQYNQGESVIVCGDHAYSVTAGWKPKSRRWTGFADKGVADAIATHLRATGNYPEGKA